MTDDWQERMLTGQQRAARDLMRKAMAEDERRKAEATPDAVYEARLKEAKARIRQILGDTLISALQLGSLINDLRYMQHVRTSMFSCGYNRPKERMLQSPDRVIGIDLTPDGEWIHATLMIRGLFNGLGGEHDRDTTWVLWANGKAVPTERLEIEIGHILWMRNGYSDRM